MDTPEGINMILQKALTYITDLISTHAMYSFYPTSTMDQTKVILLQSIRYKEFCQRPLAQTTRVGWSGIWFWRRGQFDPPIYKQEKQKNTRNSLLCSREISKNTLESSLWCNYFLNLKPPIEVIKIDLRSHWFKIEAMWRCLLWGCWGNYLVPAINIIKWAVLVTLIIFG